MLGYNLLVSFRPGKEKEAEDEMIRRLTDVGEDAEDWNVSMDPDLYLVRTVGDSKKTVQKIRRLAEHFPDVFAYTIQWIPVEKWIRSDDENIKSAVSEYKTDYPDAGVDVKLLYTCCSKDRKSAEELSSKSSGNDVVFVRIIGETAAISHLENDELADINDIREMIGMKRV